MHKSNVLSVTDGLFRETVRAVPQLEGVNGKYDNVKIEEQLVDSMVYRCVNLTINPLRVIVLKRFHRMFREPQCVEGRFIS